MAPARKFPPEGYLARSIEAQRQFITAALAGLGIPLHPGSRLVKGWRLWDGRPADRKIIYESDSEFGDACEILRDSQIYDVILQRPNQFREDPQARQRLEESLEDDLTPHLTKDTPGRNAQAELFMASGMYRASQHVQFERPREIDGQQWPDLRARIAGRYFFVEVKRARSAKKILERVSTGIGQVEATGCPGAVAIDVSFALNPTREVEQRNLPTAEYELRHGREFREQIRPLQDKLLSALRGSRVGGIFFQHHIVRRTGETGHSLSSCAMTFDNLALTGRARDAWRTFVATLPHAWASDL